MAEAAAPAHKLTIGVPKESVQGEQRVALTPDGVKKYAGAGHKELVETGAGEGASLNDEAFEAVGATIAPAGTVWSEADLILRIHKPSTAELDQMKPGAAIIAFLQPAAFYRPANEDAMQALLQVEWFANTLTDMLGVEEHNRLMDELGL